MGDNYVEVFDGIFPLYFIKNISIVFYIVLIDGKAEFPEMNEKFYF